MKSLANSILIKNSEVNTGLFLDVDGLDSIVNWRETGDFSLTSQIDLILLFLKSKECTVNIDDENAIKDFLKDNHQLIDYLYDAYFKIARYFDGDKLNLSLFVDPEGSENVNSKLFLTINTHLDVNVALSRLNNFDKEWLIPVVGNDLSKFNVDLEII
ncbi:MAG: hypothetical protein WA093_01980 [Minisyncoccales bacterium]